MQWLEQYGSVEGPFGFPMSEVKARDLEALVTSLPPELRIYQKAQVPGALSEFLPGERADVSWISTEHVDRQKHIVLSAGLDEGVYKLNPIVTLDHKYDRPPVGRSLWRKAIKSSSPKGVKAKTIYPEKPDEWTDGPWPPDQALALIKSGLLMGKSVGFLPLEGGPPQDDEVKTQPTWGTAKLIIKRWLLLEYACTAKPVNQAAIVEAIAKSLVDHSHLAWLGLDQEMLDRLEKATSSVKPQEEEEDRESTPPPLVLPPVPETTLPPETLAFTTWNQVEDSIRNRLDATNFALLIQKATQAALDKIRGRV